jgi:hypothetical protein
MVVRLQYTPPLGACTRSRSRVLLTVCYAPCEASMLAPRSSRRCGGRYASECSVHQPGRSLGEMFAVVNHKHLPFVAQGLDEGVRDRMSRLLRRPDGLLRQSLRSLSRGSLLWKGSAPPSQPRWQPGRQACTVDDPSGSHERRSSHAGVRRKAHRWRSPARASERSSAASSATSPGRLPRAGLLHRLFLADKAIRREPRRR